MLDNNERQPGTKELREFGLTTAAILAILFGLILPWLFNRAFPLWPWVVAGVLGAWALLQPDSLRPVYRGWMAIGHVLGWINTRIILGILFCLLFIPGGWVMKLLGKDPMARTIDKSKTTYRVTRDIPDRKHVEKPY